MIMSIKSIKERFLSHVNIPENSNNCWEWNGAKFQSGYGKFTIKHKQYRAHRVSYALFVDMISDNLLVCHSCDNKLCVNPNHLWLGTTQDNTRDKVKKNRQTHVGAPKGEKHGQHKLTKTDVYQIRELIEQGHTNIEIAKIFEVSNSTISDIKLGKRWNQ